MIDPKSITKAMMLARKVADDLGLGKSDVLDRPQRYASGGYLPPGHPEREANLARFMKGADKKVYNKDKSPKLFYHGTTVPEDFSEFSVGSPIHEEDASGEGRRRIYTHNDPTTYLGSHFAEEPEIANKFAKGLYGEAKGAQEGNRVIPVHLSIKKPHVTTETDMIRSMLRDKYDHPAVDARLRNEEEERRYDDPNEIDFRTRVNKFAWKLAADEDAYDNSSFAEKMAEQYRNRLINAGFDGIKYQNEVEGGNSWIAFHPTQIKSATGNNGQYDLNESDINKAEGGKILPPGHPERQANLAKFMEGAHPLLLNEDGTPRRLYHGTIKDFSAFSSGYSSGRGTGSDSKYSKIKKLGNVHYFTSDPEDANKYAELARDEPRFKAEIKRIEEARLAGAEPMQHPYNKEPGAFRWWPRDTTPAYEAEHNLRIGSYDTGANVKPVHLNMKNPLVVDMKGKPGFGTNHITHALKNGYDGVILRNAITGGFGEENVKDHYVVFDPTQIKSATGNTGQFDPSDPDITKAEGGKVKEPVEIQWTELKPTDSEQEDELNGTSKWSQNTYNGADKLLYGEAFHGPKKVGRAMIGVHNYRDSSPLELDKIWVHPDHRRTGIATRMIEQAKSMTGRKDIYSPNAMSEGKALLSNFPRTDIDKENITKAEGGEVDGHKKLFDAFNSAPINDGIENAEQSWTGGVADFGNKSAAYAVQNMPGYFDYRSHLEDAARRHLGDTFSVFRSMPEKQYQAWKNGEDIGPIGTTLNKNLAEKWHQLAAGKKYPAKSHVVHIRATPESIVMRGHQGEHEIVIDPNAISADDVNAVGIHKAEGGEVDGTDLAKGRPDIWSDPKGYQRITYLPFGYQADQSGKGIPGTVEFAVPGVVKDVVNSAYNAFTLPGDVYAGRRQPNSQDALNAALFMTPIGRSPVLASAASESALATAKKVLLPQEEIARRAAAAKYMEKSNAPPVMYHATNRARMSGFSNLHPEKVSTDKFGSHTIKQFSGTRGNPEAPVVGYAAFDPAFAEKHAGFDIKAEPQAVLNMGTSVYPVKVRATNIFDISNPEHRKMVGIEKDPTRSASSMYEDMPDNKYPWNWMDLEHNSDKIKKAGFDSYYDYEHGINSHYGKTGIGVFDPRQIKSEFARKYDPEHPDIGENRGGFIHKAEGGTVLSGGFTGPSAIASAPAQRISISALPTMQSVIGGNSFQMYAPTVASRPDYDHSSIFAPVAAAPSAALQRQYPTATADQLNEYERAIAGGGDPKATRSLMQAYGPASGVKELQPWSSEYKGDAYRRAHPVDDFGNPIGWSAPERAAPSVDANGVPAGWDQRDWENMRNFDPGSPSDEYILNNPWMRGMDTLGGNVMPGEIGTRAAERSSTGPGIAQAQALYESNKRVESQRKAAMAQNAAAGADPGEYVGNSPDGFVPMADTGRYFAPWANQPAAQAAAGQSAPKSSWSSLPSNFSFGNLGQVGASILGLTPLGIPITLANSILTGTNTIPQAQTTGSRVLDQVATQGPITNFLSRNVVNPVSQFFGGSPLPAKASGGSIQNDKNIRKAMLLAKLVAEDIGLGKPDELDTPSAYRAFGGRIAKAGGGSGELPLVGPTPDMAIQNPMLRSQVPLETVVASDNDPENTRYWGNIATPPPSSQSVLKAEAVAPVYTSRVHELLTDPDALNSMKMGRPQQWVKYLQKGGAKPEEINMYGIGEGDPNKKISREEVNSRIEGKIPKLREKLLGEGSGNKDDLEVNYGHWETEEPDDRWLYDIAVDRRHGDVYDNRHDPDFMAPYAEEAVDSYSKKHLTSPNTVGPVNIEEFVHHALEGELLSKDTAQGILDAAKNKAITPEQWSDAVDEMNKNQVAKIEKDVGQGAHSNDDMFGHIAHYDRAVHALHGAVSEQMIKHFENAAMHDNEALNDLVQQERESYYENGNAPQTRTAYVTNPNGRDLDYEIRDSGGYGGDIYVTDRRGNPIGNADSHDEAEELIRSHAAKQLGLSGTEVGQKNIDKPNVHDVGIYGEGSQWSLPGVEDYREHTLHFDPTTGRDFEGGHYDPNAVVHMRYGTVHDANGKRLLYLDELQSDWHQKGMGGLYDTPEGRSKLESYKNMYEKASRDVQDHRHHIFSGLGLPVGRFANHEADTFSAYMLMGPEDAHKYRHGIFDKYDRIASKDPALAKAMFGEDADNIGGPELIKNFQEYARQAFGDDYKKHASDHKSALVKQNNLSEAARGNLVPDAPWKNTNEWSKLAMKRALRIAADYGYDGVALSPGWVQKHRWGNEDHQKTYDDLMGGSMKSLAKQEGLNFGTASIPLLRKHAQNNRVSGVDNPDQAHAIYLEDDHKNKIRKRGFRLFKRGGYIPANNNTAVDHALKLVSKSGAMLPASVYSHAQQKPGRR